MFDPSAVLFDFNGVLVDDELLHQASFNDVLAPLGVSMTDATYRERYLGFDDRGAFRAVLADFGRPADDALVSELIARKSIAYRERAAIDLRIYPGAADTIRALAATLPVGIVSGALRDEIESALETMRVAELVRFIVAAEDVLQCKPDPEGYLAGLARIRSENPTVAAHRVVAIEDSIAGIESACAAGLRVVAVCHTYDAEALRRAGAHRIVASIAEVSASVLVDALRG